MPDQQTQQPTDIQQAIGTLQVPFHTHGGSDGPLIPVKNVSGSFISATTTPTFTPTQSVNTTLVLNTARNQLFYRDATNNVWKSVFGQPSIVSITSAASYTLNTDLYDALSITALAVAVNTIDASGTPVNFQRLMVRIKDDGTSHAITWSAKFANYGVALPTATTISKVLTVFFVYDSVAALWGCVDSKVQA